MKILFITTRCAILFIVLTATACKNKDKPLTEEEVKNFVKQVEKTIDKRDAGFLDKAVDKNELLKRAGLTKTREARNFAEGATGSMMFGKSVLAFLNKTGTYQLVKIYNKDNVWHALFRMFSDGGLNYHDMELNRHNGSVGVADIFIYTTGENFSKTIGSLFQQMVGLMDNMTGDEKWLKSMSQIKDMVLKGEHQDAYDEFQKIPASVRKGKAFQVMNIQICSGLDEEVYKKAIEEFQVLFADEPNMHLILLESFFLNKEYEKVLNSIDQLDKMIDKDPFLDYYRYLAYNVKEEPANAKKYLLQVIKNFPDFPDAQLELIATYLEEGDYTAAKPLVANYQSRKSYEQATLSTLLLAYPDFKQ